MSRAPSKAVNLWTWRRMLRDHARLEPTVLLTLFVIGTYMDGEGFTFVGQTRIAKGARTSARTVKRHIAQATRAGWLYVELTRTSTEKNRHVSFLNNYRACIPESIELSDVDEELRDCVLSSAGDVDEGGDTAMSLRPSEGGDIQRRTWGHPASNVGTSSVEGGDIAMAQELFSINSSVLTLQKEGALARTAVKASSKKTTKKKTKTEGPAHISTVIASRAKNEEASKAKRPDEPIDLESERQRQLAALRAMRGNP